MDTAQQALFRAMLTDGWFCESDGDVEWSLGYFGYVHNHPSELQSVRQAFEDTLNTYGEVSMEEFAGIWWADINSDGVIRISKIGDADASRPNTYDFAHNPAVKQAQKRFKDTVHDFQDWGNESE